MPSTPPSAQDFFRCLNATQPLEPKDPRYVPVHQGPPRGDPIAQLQRRIEWSESESVYLLTGFRGNGKSIELLSQPALLEPPPSTSKARSP